ncbi:hypothetical protein D3C86_1363610 [compost metagenome]
MHLLKLRCGGIGLHRLVDVDEIAFRLIEEMLAARQPVLIFRLAVFQHGNALIDVGLQLFQLLLLHEITLVAGGIGDVGAEFLDFILRAEFRHHVLLALGASSGKQEKQRGDSREADKAIRESVFVLIVHHCSTSSA